MPNSRKRSLSSSKPASKQKSGPGPSGPSKSTSRKVATVASKALKRPAEASDDEVQALAASVLTQSEPAETEPEPIEAESVQEVPDADYSGAGFPISPSPTSEVGAPVSAPLEAADVEPSTSDPAGPVVELIGSGPGSEPLEPAQVDIEPSDAEKFLSEVRVQVRVPVTYHFTSDALAEAHAALVRSVLSPNGRPYGVEVNGSHLRVRLT